MSLEIFEINENGAGWVSLENASHSNKIALEWAIMNNAEVKLLCHVCHVEIPSGTGTACAKHMPAPRVCKVCEYPHEGLYCHNCFTGTRVNVSRKPNGYRFSDVIRLTPVNAPKCRG